jgi:hypothetical protein
VTVVVLTGLILRFGLGVVSTLGRPLRSHPGADRARLRGHLWGEVGCLSVEQNCSTARQVRQMSHLARFPVLITAVVDRWSRSLAPFYRGTESDHRALAERFRSHVPWHL